ncbi:MAG TPA: RNA 2',3'-cyclic phosphodiesterase [Candidatus Binatia bacterium]|nr:RNA 2',3'-cyclic phosphodiesterase [Candidatus Binatia bacterium]
MIRAFIAVEIEPQTVRQIIAAVADLKPRIPAIRWVPPTNFHFTLKFLGDIEESKIEPIAQALELALHPFPRFTINAKGLGVFPDLKRPRILWVGLEGKGLAELTSKVETALESLGFAPEKKEFKPHLTLGRWRQFDRSSRKFGVELERWKAHEFGESTVAEVIFFRSELKREGAIYHPLKVVALAK